MDIQMQLDHTPLFRKPITAWYDANFVCWIIIIMMVFVSIFAVAGIYVGSSIEEFREYVWFPAVLSVLSLFLALKIFLRLRQRSKNS